MSERNGGRERSKQSGASERVSGASERVSGPVLQPVFLVVLTHSELCEGEIWPRPSGQSRVNQVN